MPAPTSPRYRSAPSRALILNPTDPETLYELIDEIASGAFGTVYRATYLETNEAVALKICCLEDTQSTLDELLIEVEILKRCSHPNIVKCFGAHHKGNDVVVSASLLHYFPHSSPSSLLSPHFPSSLSPLLRSCSLLILLRFLWSR
jgi:serine/threonine protein kinase